MKDILSSLATSLWSNELGAPYRQHQIGI